MDFRIVVFSLVFCISGCANVHTGNYARSHDGKDEIGQNGLIISADFREHLSIHSAGFITVTFENTTDEWLELSNVELDFGKEGQSRTFEPIVGEKLSQLLRSVVRRNRIEDYNNSLVMSSLLLVGALASGSKNSAVSSTGNNVVAMSSVALVGSSVQKKLDNVTDVSKLPHSHLLSGIIMVPPNLTTTKWVVLGSQKNHSVDFIDEFVLSFNDQYKQKYKFDVNFSSGFDSRF